MIDLDNLRQVLAAKGVAAVCPACGMPVRGNPIRIELPDRFVGDSCGHCGHLRLFREDLLEASES